MRHAAVTALLGLLLATTLGGRAAADDGREERAPAKPPAPGQATREARLRVATFNVWAIPLVSKQRSERLARLPRALRGLALDVVCLQELWMTSDQRDVRKGLKTTHPHSVMGGGGLMLLSRHRIREQRFVRFPDYPGLSMPEQVARKGLLDVVLETPAGLVRVVNTHLALAFGKDNPKLKQLRFLLEHLDDRRKIPVILAADLNVPKVHAQGFSTGYRMLKDADFHDTNPPTKRPDGSWDQGEPTRIGWPRPSGKPAWGFYPDHIAMRAGRTASVSLERFQQALDRQETALSDHNLLYADVVIRPTTAGR